MTALTEDRNTLLRRVADDHAFIRRTIAKMATISEAPPLADLLESLVPVLERHFAEEEREAGGLRDVVGQEAPHYLDRLDEVLGEHIALLEQVRALRERALEHPSVPYSELTGDVTHFIGALEQHELRETSLFSEAISIDLGAGD